MDPDQTAQAGLDPCWSQTHYVGSNYATTFYYNISFPFFWGWVFHHTNMVTFQLH
jgi:hypothetical protein